MGDKWWNDLTLMLSDNKCGSWSTNQTCTITRAVRLARLLHEYAISARVDKILGTIDANICKFSIPLWKKPDTNCSGVFLFCFLHLYLACLKDKCVDLLLWCRLRVWVRLRSFLPSLLFLDIFLWAFFCSSYSSLIFSFNFTRCSFYSFAEQSAYLPLPLTPPVSVVLKSILRLHSLSHEQSLYGNETVTLV